jgi:hypothetical protein
MLGPSFLPLLTPAVTYSTDPTRVHFKLDLSYSTTITITRNNDFFFTALETTEIITLE